MHGPCTQKHAILAGSGLRNHVWPNTAFPCGGILGPPQASGRRPDLVGRAAVTPKKFVENGTEVVHVVFGHCPRDRGQRFGLGTPSLSSRPAASVETRCAPSRCRAAHARLPAE